MTLDIKVIEFILIYLKIIDWSKECTGMTDENDYITRLDLLSLRVSEFYQFKGISCMILFYVHKCVILFTWPYLSKGRIYFQGALKLICIYLSRGSIFMDSGLWRTLYVQGHGVAQGVNDNCYETVHKNFRMHDVHLYSLLL